MCTCARASASPLSAAMALRRFGVAPAAANANAALRETEKATAERDAEARAAFEATFKRAHRVPPTLAPTGRRVRDAKQFDRFDDDATAREAMRARGVDPDALGTTRAIGPATTGSGYARGVADPPPLARTRSPSSPARSPASFPKRLGPPPARASPRAPSRRRRTDRIVSHRARAVPSARASAARDARA